MNAPKLSETDKEILHDIVAGGSDGTIFRWANAFTQKRLNFLESYDLIVQGRGPDLIYFATRRGRAIIAVDRI